MIATSSIASLATGFAVAGSDALVALLTNSDLIRFAAGVAVVSAALYFVLRRLHWI